MATVNWSEHILGTRLHRNSAWEMQWERVNRCKLLLGFQNKILAKRWLGLRYFKHGRIAKWSTILKTQKTAKIAAQVIIRLSVSGTRNWQTFSTESSLILHYQLRMGGRSLKISSIPKVRCHPIPIWAMSAIREKKNWNNNSTVAGTHNYQSMIKQVLWIKQMRSLSRSLIQARKEKIHSKVLKKSSLR